MKRQAIRTIENKVTEFIPLEYKDFKEDAEDVYEKPLIAGGKRLTREQKFEFRDMIKVSYPKGTDLTKLSKEELSALARTHGQGAAFKFIWDNCVHYLKNVIINIDGEDKIYEKVSNTENAEIKDLLWQKAQDFDSDIIQIVSHFLGASDFTEEESKN